MSKNVTFCPAATVRMVCPEDSVTSSMSRMPPPSTDRVLVSCLVGSVSSTFQKRTVPSSPAARTVELFSQLHFEMDTFYTFENGQQRIGKIICQTNNNNNNEFTCLVH